MARSKASKGLKDPAYLAFIASLPCVVCLAWESEQRTRTTVAHVGDRGLSQKCSDRETLPLCVDHHQEGKNAHHKMGKRFWSHHELDRDVLIRLFNERYNEAHGVQEPSPALLGIPGPA